MKIGGKKKFLLTADYPYYRDVPELWKKKLRLIKKAGIDIVTFYIPWRHHFIGGEYDFTGRTQPNRNVIGFLELCKSTGLMAIVKPGPFIHAETEFGGLPDFLSPDVNKKMEYYCDINRVPNLWGERSLPSPVCKEFLFNLKKWLKAVKKFILQPYRYPKGPIIGVQIWNEGIYSDANAEIYKYDFSPSAVDMFKKLYKTKPPAADSALSKFERSCMLWADFQSRYMQFLYEFVIKNLKTPVPYFINLNPPSAGTRKFFAWFCRNVPERWKNVCYGYTDWIGVISYDKEAFYRYLCAAKRHPGVNLEENWGFSKLYDAKYANPDVCYFQSLFDIACGAKGVNIYTVCGTESWDDNLDSTSPRPYPATAPIDPEGKPGPKFSKLRELTAFIKKYEEFLMEGTPLVSFSIGIYPPAFSLPAWGSGSVSYREFLFLLKQARRKFLDFDFVNLQDSALSVKKPLLVPFVDGFDRRGWLKLFKFVKKGRVLVVICQRGQFSLFKQFFPGKEVILDNNLKKIFTGKGKVYVFEKSASGHGMIGIEELFDFLVQEKILQVYVKANKPVEILTLANYKQRKSLVFVFNIHNKRKKLFLEAVWDHRKIPLELAPHSVKVVEWKWRKQFC